MIYEIWPFFIVCLVSSGHNWVLCCSFPLHRSWRPSRATAQCEFSLILIPYIFLLRWGIKIPESLKNECLSAKVFRGIVVARIFFFLLHIFKNIFSKFYPINVKYKGAFSNYMGRILPLFNPFPLCGQFLYPEHGQNRHFLTPSPPHLVHVVIECPLRKNLQV